MHSTGCAKWIRLCLQIHSRLLGPEPEWAFELESAWLSLPWLQGMDGLAALLAKPSLDYRLPYFNSPVDGTAGATARAAPADARADEPRNAPRAMSHPPYIPPHVR